jgi:hypothetical protein
MMQPIAHARCCGNADGSLPNHIETSGCWLKNLTRTYPDVGARTDPETGEQVKILASRPIRRQRGVIAHVTK